LITANAHLYSRAKSVKSLTKNNLSNPVKVKIGWNTKEEYLLSSEQLSMNTHNFSNGFAFGKQSSSNMINYRPYERSNGNVNQISWVNFVKVFMDEGLHYSIPLRKIKYCESYNECNTCYKYEKIVVIDDLKDGEKQNERIVIYLQNYYSNWSTILNENQRRSLCDIVNKEATLQKAKVYQMRKDLTTISNDYIIKKYEYAMEKKKEKGEKVTPERNIEIKKEIIKMNDEKIKKLKDDGNESKEKLDNLNQKSEDLEKKYSDLNNKLSPNQVKLTKLKQQKTDLETKITKTDKDIETENEKIKSAYSILLALESKKIDNTETEKIKNDLTDNYKEYIEKADEYEYKKNLLETDKYFNMAKSILKADFENNSVLNELLATNLYNELAKISPAPSA